MLSVNVMDFDLILVLGESLFVYIMKSNCLVGKSMFCLLGLKKKLSSDEFLSAFCLPCIGSSRTNLHLFLECLNTLLTGWSFN